MSQDRAQQLAMILQAIEDAEQEMSEYRAAHKDRIERLRGEAFKLRNAILFGQLTITEAAEANLATATGD